MRCRRRLEETMLIEGREVRWQKIPAVLLYTSDFLIGVADMPFLDRGYYITLLCLQHQKGHLSEETICFSLGLSSVSEIPKVMEKFKADEDGKYYQHRMEEESEKRAAYSESRRNNGSKGGRPPKEEPSSKNHMDSHMDNHMEDENDNGNEDIGNKGKKGNERKTNKKVFISPTLNEIEQYAASRNSTVDPKKFWDFFDAGDWIDSEGKPVRNWKQKFITWEGRKSERSNDGAIKSDNKQNSTKKNWNLPK